MDYNNSWAIPVLIVLAHIQMSAFQLLVQEWGPRSNKKKRQVRDTAQALHNKLRGRRETVFLSSLMSHPTFLEPFRHPQSIKYPQEELQYSQ